MNLKGFINVIYDEKKGEIYVYDKIENKKILILSKNDFVEEILEDEETLLEEILKNNDLCVIIEDLLEDYKNLINPKDYKYYNNLYEISLDRRTTNRVYANSENDALEILVGYFVDNDLMGDLIEISDVLEENQEEYIYIDCSEYCEKSEIKGWRFYLETRDVIIKELD